MSELLSSSEKVSDSSSSSSDESESESEPEPEPEYAAIEILQERQNQYLIKWAGNDPATGKAWKPSWEPKRNANELLIDEWLKTGKNKKRRRTTITRTTTRRRKRMITPRLSTKSRITTSRSNSTSNDDNHQLNNLKESTTSPDHLQQNEKRLTTSTKNSKRKKKIISSTASSSSPNQSITKVTSSSAQTQLSQDSSRSTPSKRTNKNKNSVEQTTEESSRKRRKINHDSNQTQVNNRSSPTRNRSSSIESLPSPTQFITTIQQPHKSQSTSQLNSSQKLKHVIVPETQSDDGNSNSKINSPCASASEKQNSISTDLQIPNQPLFTAANSNSDPPSSPHNPINLPARSNSNKLIAIPTRDAEHPLSKSNSNHQKDQQEKHNEDIDQFSDDTSFHYANLVDDECQPKSKKNAEQIVLASKTDKPSKISERARQIYEPDEETAELIAGLNDYDDPDHQNQILQYLNSCSIQPNDLKFITEFILDPVAYLADPQNEIEIMRSQYLLGRHMAFELKRSKLGSICLWFDLEGSTNARYWFAWNEIEIVTKLQSMIFGYAPQSQKSASQSPIVPRFAPIEGLGLIEAQTTNDSSRSHISENKAELSLAQEEALEGRNKSGSPPPQDDVAQAENEATSPLLAGEIPNAQNELLVDPPPQDKSSPMLEDSQSNSPHDGSSPILENSESDSNASKHDPMRIKELEKAVEALQALLGGALDVNADADERERVLAETYESMLKKEREITLELEQKNSQLDIELTGQRARTINLEDELNKMKAQVDGYETRLKIETEKSSKLKAENFQISVELTGQRASMMKVEDELKSTKDNVKSLESMLKESRHPAKQIYDTFISRHKLESSRLQSELTLSMSKTNRLQMLMDKENELMKSFSSQNSRILDENQKLKATILKQSVEFKNLKINFDDLSEADGINKTRIELLEGFIKKLQQEVSQLSAEDVNETNDRGSDELSKEGSQQTEEAINGDNLVQEAVVPDNPKHSPSSNDVQALAHNEHDRPELISIHPEIAVFKPTSEVEVSSLPPPPPPTSGLPLEPTSGVSISIQMDSLGKKDQLSNQNKLQDNNDSELWPSYEPISQLDRPSLGGDQNATNNLELGFLDYNGHEIEDDSMENLECSIELTQHGMNNQESNQSSNPHSDEVEVREKREFKSNTEKKSLTRATSSTLGSHKNATEDSLDSLDSNQSRHSCPPNGQATFKSLRSSTQFSSPLYLPQIGTFVTTTTASASHDGIPISTIGTLPDSHTVLGDISQSFSQPQ